MALVPQAKQLVQSLFNAAAFEIRKKDYTRLDVVQQDKMAGVLNHLWILGLRPWTVIDVGVATQTLERYRQFNRLLDGALSQLDNGLFVRRMSTPRRSGEKL